MHHFCPIPRVKSPFKYRDAVLFGNHRHGQALAKCGDPSNSFPFPHHSFELKMSQSLPDYEHQALTLSRPSVLLLIQVCVHQHMTVVPNYYLLLRLSSANYSIHINLSLNRKIHHSSFHHSTWL